MTRRAQAAVARDGDWRVALADLKRQMPLLTEGAVVDLALLFASHEYAEEFPQLVEGVRDLTGASCLMGCSGQGVIGPRTEVEDEPALALLVLSLPDALLRPIKLSQRDLEERPDPPAWRELTDVPPEDVNAWLIFGDPFSLDAESLLATFSRAYPGLPLVGGLASGDFRKRRTHLFLDGDVYDSGAVALALGGAYTIRTVVSQGCTPVGETWTITGVKANVIETIGMRRALDVLVETVHGLPLPMQQRAGGNLFIGLAMDEYKDEFRRGDFLIRNLVAVDPESGVLAVGAVPRVGQTLQFQLRDSLAADEDLIEMLERARAGLADQAPVGAILCSCNGRGAGLFGSSDHDARAVEERLGPLPLAGFFCNGEIGPVGAMNFLHGFTASIAIIVPT